MQDFIICHPELVSGSSHSKTLGSTQKEKVVVSSMGQMLNQVQHDKKKKAAFTLAEVLITLGIIGVVAAMTLPTLISNYQKKVYVNQLKKAYSSLSQGFTLMMAKDGVTELKNSEAFSGPSFVCRNNNIATDNCKNIREALQNTFSGITFSDEVINYKYLNRNSTNSSNKLSVIHFPDGMWVYNYMFWNITQGPTNGIMKGAVGNMTIDINGAKNPNTYGRDIFVFYIGNVGGVYPSGSHAVSEIQSGLPDVELWNGNFPESNCKMDGHSEGWGCAARVLEEDAMNY